jgi:hypothetical protein
VTRRNALPDGPEREFYTRQLRTLRYRYEDAGDVIEGCDPMEWANRRDVPKAAVSNRSKADNLFDHLVGAGEQHRRNLKAERLGSFEVDYQFELGRLQDGQISGLLPLQNAAHIDASLAITFGSARSVADQTAVRSIFPQSIDRRNGITRC